MTPDERAEAALPCSTPHACDGDAHYDDCPAYYRSAVTAQIREAAGEEREAIANVVEVLAAKYLPEIVNTELRTIVQRFVDNLAAATRARGKQETGEK